MAPLSLPAFLLFCAGLCLAEVISLRSQPDNQITDLATRVNVRRSHDNYAEPENVIDTQLELLDIVLVASVDGNLHALNRTSGDNLWSMSTPVGEDNLSSLGPLVRTKHPEAGHDEDEAQEVYVIEPQSGEIYVMPTPDSPLQRLPFSMAQLVEMSPYSVTGEDSIKVFVGKKETSLLLVELETGRVKATVDPHSECPWDPFEDLSRQSDDELDLDELDGSKPPRESKAVTEVFIGRTDYHISIHTRPSEPGLPRPPVQNLSFSTYGPNNQDLVLQRLYRRTVDNTYIQSLPNGKVMSFKTTLNSEHPDIAPDARALWGRSYNSPIVAVFDVVKTHDRTQPFVLLQPRISLQDLLPNFDLVSAAKQDRLPNIEAAYVGMVEETGSLFAMSPDRYPLVVFGDTNFEEEYPRGSRPSIDPPSNFVLDGRDFPSDVDSITRVMKRRKLKEACRNGSKDKRCLTGVRRLESSRLSRLLDGPASVPFPPHMADPRDHPNHSASLPGAGNASIQPHPGAGAHLVEDSSRGYANLSAQALSTYTVGLLTLLAMFVWMFKRFERRPTPPPAQTPPMHVDVSVVEATLMTPDQTTPTSETTESTLVEKPSPRIKQEDDGGAETPRPKGRAVSFGEAVKIATVTPEDDDEAGENAEGEESDADQAQTPGRRKPARRKRGKKKPKPGPLNGSGENGKLEGQDSKPAVQDSVPEEPQTPKANGSPEAVHVVSPSSIVVPPPSPAVPVIPSLVVSDTILGFGSHGTVVFKGSLQGRAVAVKRLLQDFVTLAAREVNILQESDDHPNVVRYYYQESHANFLYIALELCPATLADVIERPDQFREISNAFDPKRALRQITSGLRHLHALKVIHRDIKPQNILISQAKKGAGDAAGYRMLISDFGLCKKLEIDQTSFLPTATAGTVGWRAPEILRDEVRIDDSAGEESQSSRGSVGSSSGGGTGGSKARLTKSVDLFALGCLFYYVLTNGGHPFGERYEREINILKNAKNLDGLARFGEEGSEAVDLIDKMLSPEPYSRPDTATCLLHPYFWDPGKRLTFLQEASDRFEIMCRDPRDPMLVELEKDAFSVVGNDWNARLDKWFIENLGKYRKYDGRSVQDLMRALRNKKHHYQDLPDNVKRQIGSMPEGFLSYFTRRFPRLFLHVHSVVSSSSLRYESMFRAYFELNE